MPRIDFQLLGEAEFVAAIRRNPQTVLLETRKYLQRAMAVVRSIIWNKPWRIGGPPGGVPVDTGNLRGSHQIKFDAFSASIGPSRAYLVRYAPWVHEGTQRMDARPWLDYAAEQAKKDGRVRQHQAQFLKAITHNLAS